MSDFGHVLEEVVDVDLACEQLVEVSALATPTPFWRFSYVKGIGDTDTKRCVEVGEGS